MTPAGWGSRTLFLLGTPTRGQRPAASGDQLLRLLNSPRRHPVQAGTLTLPRRKAPVHVPGVRADPPPLQNPAVRQAVQATGESLIGHAAVAHDPVVFA